MYDEVEVVNEFELENHHEAIGFKDGRLVHWDGERTRPVTLKRALQLWIHMELTWDKCGVADGGWDQASRAKFLKMVVGAIR